MEQQYQKVIHFLETYDTFHYKKQTPKKIKVPTAKLYFYTSYSCSLIFLRGNW